MLNLRCTALRAISVCDMVVYWSPKKLRFKMINKCLKKQKTFECPVLLYSLSPIDCSVMKTVWQMQNLISIFNHKYLDNQTVDRLVKIMGFLTDIKVYNYHCSMSLINNFFEGSKTKLPDPFNMFTEVHSLMRHKSLAATWTLTPVAPIKKELSCAHLWWPNACCFTKADIPPPKKTQNKWWSSIQAEITLTRIFFFLERKSLFIVLLRILSNSILVYVCMYRYVYICLYWLKSYFFVVVTKVLLWFEFHCKGHSLLSS